MRWTRVDALVGVLVTALVAVVYLPHALHAGWYYDDWSVYQRMAAAGSSFGEHLAACRMELAGSRELACLYHSAEYGLLGAHRWAYNVWAMVFLLALALLGYRILRWCRVGWQWAGLAAALLVVFPASDTTRMWPVAVIAEYVLVLHAIGLLLALNGLASRSRTQQIALHLVSAALFVVAMATYEIVVPLIALGGVVYLAAYRRRAVLWRGGVDLALAIVFVGYRTILHPPPSNSGFVVHRDLHGELERGRTLLRGAWDSWSIAFATSGRIALLGVVTLLAAAATAAALDVELRRRLLPWLGLLAASLAIATLSALVFITANDFYVPGVSGTFNRLNAPGAFAGCAAFVALLGLTFVLARRLVPIPFAATTLVVLIVAGTSWHQLGISSDHKRAWEASWRAQSHALEGYRTALRDVPANASIVGFDTPIWERGYVPVFAATWDLRGAIAYTTRHNPTAATPLTPDVGCGHDAVEIGAVPGMPYVGGQPVYFVSPTRRAAVRIASQAACTRQIERWGRPPLFG